MDRGRSVNPSARRHHYAAVEASSSEDEVDAFSMLAARASAKKKKGSASLATSLTVPPKKTMKRSRPPPTGFGVEDGSSDGSSDVSDGDSNGAFRGSRVSSAVLADPAARRRAEMDALLRELEASRARNPLNPEPSPYEPGDAPGSMDDGDPTTTNLFVGNLDPTTTEEDLSDVFRTVGDLYSVKIMWPRTAEERARNRNTGFVCFMNRDDAAEALEGLDDTDPFRVGRRIVVRWGKNVKKKVQRGTGGVAVAPIRKKLKKNSLLAHHKNKAPQNLKQVHDSDLNVHHKTAVPTFPKPMESKAAAATPTPLTLSTFTTVPTPTTAAPTPATFTPAAPTTLPGTATLTTTALSAPPCPSYDPKKDAATSIRVILPPDARRRGLIDAVARYVARDGTHLEARLLDREMHSSAFFFLHPGPLHPDNTTPPDILAERIYYRWRVYANCQSDHANVWHARPFQMFRGGRWWLPPPLDAAAAEDESRTLARREDEILARQEERRRIAGQRRTQFATGRQLEQAKWSSCPAGSEDLRPDLRRELREMLDELTVRRSDIAACMAFCFDHSGSAGQIAEMLREAATDEETGADARIARLFLLSDVLFNSQQPGVRNAFCYRDAVERMAPAVFAGLGEWGRSKGRLTANKLEGTAQAVLDAWGEWGVYNQGFLDELLARFEGREVVSKEKEKVATGNTDEVDVDGVSLDDGDDVDGEPLDMEDVDGEPFDEDDVDGEPLEDGDVDGEPMVEDDDVDAVPLDANLL
uniref:RRM domain-containing protein n=2 Tax=Corethron hystrix TaxID=216773 RepID=A0A7S1BG70_9STRA|mmetsp:Transcript_26391/g.60795  ORF Transcript_26391/g.60795 Transcript_26391/m.60795 type:complete len:755 (+) Transcript_26391:125-2389(+)